MQVYTTVFRRRTGFSRPWATAQICAWIALVVSCVQFAAFITVVLPFELAIAATAFFAVLVLGVLYFGIKTQMVDPIDQHLVRSLQAAAVPQTSTTTTSNRNNNNHKNNGEPRSNYFPSTPTTLFEHCYVCYNSHLAIGERAHNPADTTRPSPTAINNNNNADGMKQCWICDTQVAEQSMHCKFCNKCIARFDHHCMWLNTCIGSANYPFFVRTMQFLFAMEVTHVVAQSGLILEYFLWNDDRLRNWMALDLPQLVTGVLFAGIAFNAIAILLLGQLLYFHIQLQRNNLTTYQYIVQDHKKKREQARREEDLRNQRLLAMEAAYSDGRAIRALQLRLGGQCREAGCASCDPMQMPDENNEPPLNPEEGFASALGRGPLDDHDNEDDDELVDDIGNADDENDVQHPQSLQQTNGHNHGSE